MQLTLILILNIVVADRGADAQSLSDKVHPLFESSCFGCHTADSETGLDLSSLSDELSSPDLQSTWERIYDRVRKDEMPPATEERPDAAVRQLALDAIRSELGSASLERQQREGRVPARRLTKRELNYTLRDLLQINADVTSAVPEEVDAGDFDTVGRNQRISAVHMDGYLEAADTAMELAIRLGTQQYAVNSNDYAYLNEWHEKPVNDGGSVTRPLDRGIALFVDIDYLTQFQFFVVEPGMFRITSEVEAYQARKPITVKLIVKEPSGGARLILARDLEPGIPETLTVDTFMRPGESAYLTFDAGGQAAYGPIVAAGGAKNFRGKGLAIRSQKIEGPLNESWPPPSTQKVLEGISLEPLYGSEIGPFRAVMEDEPIQHVEDVVRRMAPLIFRRPVTEDEVRAFASLAEPALADERTFVDAVKVPLKAMLTSMQFLLHDAQPGELNDFALASRLSYFLWMSMPDDALFRLAADGRLKDDRILHQQVERMLQDEKSDRFVEDFVGQWLRLYHVNATTPDEDLYPEFDELLADAIPRETPLFFRELLDQNLGVDHLLDSDFTFVNRRLAEHYGIPDVTGQEFRRVDLSEDSVRGGVLTQAAILKTTANGTVTSPVTRGNFVLTDILGTPPSPPPPDVGSIEPDTRGKTTIREILAAHRDIETCAACHRRIDPPGFALECFDPIGRYRTRYRSTAPESGLFAFLSGGATYSAGPEVDASGITSSGVEFAGIREFKRELLKDREQIARNLISKLVVYSTGGEIQFADRAEIESILNDTREDGFPLREIIHRIVQSRLFRHL